MDHGTGIDVLGAGGFFRWPFFRGRPTTVRQQRKAPTPMGPERTFTGRATLYPGSGVASETFANPTDVTILQAKASSPSDKTFAGNVASIKVVGGDRRTPTGFFNGYQFWNAQSVSVKLKDGSVRNWKAPYSVAIRGGMISSSDYLAGVDVLGIDVPVSDREVAIHGIGLLGGGLLLVRLWPGAWPIKFLLGSTLGWHGATLLTGTDPLKKV